MHRKTDRFGSSKLQIINHKALETLPMALKPAVNQVNLLLLLLQEQGDLASTGDKVPYTTCERPIVRSLANWKKHKLCLLPLHTTTTTPCQPERNDVAYSLFL